MKPAAAWNLRLFCSILQQVSDVPKEVCQRLPDLHTIHNVAHYLFKSRFMRKRLCKCLSHEL